MSAIEPGWYRDPDDARRHRFWDGERWRSEGEELRRRGDTGSGPRAADEDEPPAQGG